MKVVLSWLEEYFGTPLDPSEVAERLTLSGIEVEAVTPVGARDPLVVVGEVVAIEALGKVPGVFRLSVRADRLRRVISNAPGLALGQHLAVALPGATLFSPSALELSEVEASTLYGELSEAVLVSAPELGTGDDASRPVVFARELEPGSPVSAALGSSAAGDVVLTLAILPNIARCQSMQGVAREVAALLGRTRLPERAPAEYAAAGGLSPSIDAPDAASFLGVLLLDGVRVGRSPAWLERRLLLAGMTPINNVVDASNYAMLELGQPTHPYDADRVPSLDLGVRRTRPGDRLLTLQQPEDGEPMPLPEGAPVIVSNDVPVALAGVLGGRPTSIHEGTKRVLLEFAAFDYVAIRRSQQATKVYSEASARFSRGVNPELPPVAARRFVELLRESCPELRVISGGTLSLGTPPPRTIVLRLAELNGSLGTDFDLAEPAECLARAGLEVRRDDAKQELVVTAGNARPDLALPCDLVEEVARLSGYDRIPETLPAEPIPERLHDDTLSVRERLRDALVRAGLQEILSYTLNGPELEARLLAGHAGLAPPPAVPVLNPVSAERSQLRTSLLAQLLQSARTNLRHSTVCRLFEIGPVFLPGETPDELPVERERAAVLLAGAAAPASLHDKEPRSVDFFDLKAVVLDALSCLGANAGIELVPTDEAPFRPGAAARLRRGERDYGVLGAVHPRVLAAFDFDAQSVLVADLALDAVLADVPRRTQFAEYDRLPSIELDVALIVSDAVTVGKIREVVRAAAGPLLRDVEAFDQFTGPQFGAGRKAVAVRLRLNAGERTLEMAEALAVRVEVTRALSTHLAAQIRE